MNARFRRLVEKRRARVGILGLGYVGLPLAMEFVRAGFDVTGFEVVPEKARALNAGRSHVKDVPSAAVRRAVRSGRFRATTDFELLRGIDAVSLCVPTPLGKTRDPDMSFVEDASRAVAARLHRGMVVVLESTTYPGTTSEVLLPLLSVDGLRVGKDFYLAFSPERVDPGNPVYGVRNTPKVIGGITPACTEAAAFLYSRVVDRVVPVSSAAAAEMVKLLENTFRSVNIGLVNEVALMCDRLRLDPWEVIDAAATKPFGFMRFTPGPGIGGHCIPIDPLYLSWKLRSLNYQARFIELADSVNSKMPDHVVEKLALALNDRRKAVKGARVLVLGVAYKRDVEDLRESPALEVIRLLRERGAEVRVCDPHTGPFRIGDEEYRPVPCTPRELRAADAAVIVTDHSAFDWGRIVRHSRLVLDTRNATAGVRHRPSAKGKVVPLSRTVLVTGAAGFLGSSVSAALLARGDVVRGLDDFDPFYDPAIKRRNLEEVRRGGDLPLVQGDIRDPAAVAESLRGCDAVIHLAAKAGVRPSFADPVTYADVNVRGTSVVLEAALAAGIRTFVAASSSSVYGVRSAVPFREEDPCDRPASPYAATKRAMERLLESRQAETGIDVPCLRFFTAYGPRQRPEMAIHLFARAIEEGRPLTLFGDGSTRRDYTYADDIVDGVLRALDRGRGFRIYNLGESRTVALAELVALLEAALGKKAVVERRPDQPGDVPLTCADVSRARSELGYEPRVPIEEGLRRFVAWLRSRS